MTYTFHNFLDDCHKLGTIQLNNRIVHIVHLVFGKPIVPILKNFVFLAIHKRFVFYYKIQKINELSKH